MIGCAGDPRTTLTPGDQAEGLYREQAAEHADCPFCQIVAGLAPATVVRDWPDAMAFFPLHPVDDGHTLVIPKQHVSDFASDPEASAVANRRIAELMRWTDRPMNVITSRGREATQSVFHAHWHLVPRAENDGLALPWCGGKSKRKAPHA